MTNPFLSKNYVALALIKAKYEIFNEDFATMSELNRFTLFMQKEFNNRDLGVAIAYDLDREDFDIIKGRIIMVSDRCCYNLDTLSTNVLSVLTNPDLISQFFINLENDRIQTVECTKVVESGSHQKKKVLNM